MPIIARRDQIPKVDNSSGVKGNVYAADVEQIFEIAEAIVNIDPTLDLEVIVSQLIERPYKIVRDASGIGVVLRIAEDLPMVIPVTEALDSIVVNGLTITVLDPTNAPYTQATLNTMFPYIVIHTTGTEYRLLKDVNGTTGLSNVVLSDVIQDDNAFDLLFTTPYTGIEITTDKPIILRGTVTDTSTYVVSNTITIYLDSNNSSSEYGRTYYYTKVGNAHRFNFISPIVFNSIHYDLASPPIVTYQSIALISELTSEVRGTLKPIPIMGGDIPVRTPASPLEAVSITDTKLLFKGISIENNNINPHTLIDEGANLATDFPNLIDTTTLISDAKDKIGYTYASKLFPRQLRFTGIDTVDTPITIGTVGSYANLYTPNWGSIDSRQWIYGDPLYSKVNVDAVTTKVSLIATDVPKTLIEMVQTNPLMTSLARTTLSDSAQIEKYNPVILHSLKYDPIIEAGVHRVQSCEVSMYGYSNAMVFNNSNIPVDTNTLITKYTSVDVTNNIVEADVQEFVHTSFNGTGIFDILATGLGVDTIDPIVTSLAISSSRNMYQNTVDNKWYISNRKRFPYDAVALQVRDSQIVTKDPSRKENVGLNYMRVCSPNIDRNGNKLTRGISTVSIPCIPNNTTVDFYVSASQAELGEITMTVSDIATGGIITGTLSQAIINYNLTSVEQFSLTGVDTFRLNPNGTVTIIRQLPYFNQCIIMVVGIVNLEINLLSLNKMDAFPRTLSIPTVLSNSIIMDGQNRMTFLPSIVNMGMQLDVRFLCHHSTGFLYNYYELYDSPIDITNVSELGFANSLDSVYIFMGASGMLPVGVNCGQAVRTPVGGAIFRRVDGRMHTLNINGYRNRKVIGGCQSMQTNGTEVTNILTYDGNILGFKMNQRLLGGYGILNEYGAMGTTLGS